MPKLTKVEPKKTLNRLNREAEELPKKENEKSENTINMELLKKQEEEIEKLKETASKMEREMERLRADADNIKVNYIAPIVAVLAYIFFDLYPVNLFEWRISPLWGAIIAGVGIELFLLKENVRYAKFVIRKTLLKRA